MEALRAKQLVLIVDDHDRENEGDLVIAAEHVTAEVINFMALRARGLICVAVSAEIAARKELAHMVARNEDEYGTAFTVSVDGAPQFGVTTGISAHDRARTVQLLIDDRLGPGALRRPGHMFPLIAHALGVLGRRGHTEASTDLCELAGLSRAAVIVEILHPNGSMARAPHLDRFAQRHEIPLLSVADIVDYRQRKSTPEEILAGAAI